MSPLFTNGLPAVLSGICSVSFLYFGIYIYPVALKDIRFRPLLYMCFLSSAWSLCYVMYFLNIETGGTGLWQRFIYAGMLVFAFFPWFMMRYTALIRNKKVICLVHLALWIPPLTVAYKSISSNAVAKDFPLGFWFLLTQVQTTIYNLAGIIFLVLYNIKQKTNKGRMQTHIFCISGFVLLSLSWIADYYLGFRNAQNIIPLWLLIWIGILLYTIRRYRFITITPDFISRDITENIEEGIILLDPGLELIFANRAVLAMLNVGGVGRADLPGLVAERHVLDDEFKKLIGSESISFKARLNLRPRGSNKRIAVDMKVKKVIDSFRDLSGFLIIVSRVKELEELKARYRITARELDVIRQLAIGKTNHEIADILRLTERTIETHLTNIYGKLGVGNRIELLNLLSEYHSLQKGAEEGRAAAGDAPRLLRERAI